MRRLLLISPLLLAIFVILIVIATYDKSSDPAQLSEALDETPNILDVIPTAVTPAPTRTTPEPTPGPSPTPMPEFLYTVLDGETLWGIANQFETSIEEIMFANPELNPAGLIFPSDQLVIPGSQNPSATITAESWTITGQVTADGSGLRLRDGPSLDHEVILELAALTPLSITGRTEDNAWLEVRTNYDDLGWVYAEWVDLFISLEDIQISGESIPAIAQTETTAPAEWTSTPESPTQPSPYPYISGVSDYVREIFNHGQALGNHPNLFSKVGDSITVSDAFLYPIGGGKYSLYEYSYLQPVIDFYSEARGRTNNSFANVSLAASIGWSAHALLTSDVSHETLCGETESPLECEYRWLKPSVALIMLGTNDVPNTQLSSYENAMREIIETTIQYGIIPILSTIPPIHMGGTEGRVDSINSIITSLASEYDVPLLDYWAALQGLPNDGLRSDGVHPSLAPAGHNADFTPENLQYGMPVRSLTALQALDLVWRTVLPEG
jgi:LysM repeat protein